MGKREKKNKNKSGIIGLVLLLAVILVLALAVMPRETHRSSGQETVLPEEQTETVSPEVTDAATTAAALQEVEYPVVLEDGRLLLESLFQFDGMNPDCALEPGSSIASITVKNVSEEFLTEAWLRLELADGRTVEFCVTNLPAGKATMAFAMDNTQLEGNAVCVDVSCDTVWDSMTEAVPEAVSVSVSGTTVTITNHTSQEIPALTIYCRDIFDEEYFGGKAYEYTVNNLSANGTATVEALDSILGLIEVVRIEVHE